MGKEQNRDQQPFCSKRLVLGIIGCFGGLFIHLIIGSLYQWGIINIYITSYYRLADNSVTLQNNAIAFPVMMLCIGVTMRLGLYLAEISHPLIIMGISIVIQSALIFSSSYAPNMGSFIVIYGVLFGLFSGIIFMIPIVQCNRYFPGKKMYVNGVILTGTGLGSLVFGLFSYNFLNPNKISPVKGYYIGNAVLQSIAERVPECLRWLSLLYLLIGLSGILMVSYVCVTNRIKQKQIKQNDKEETISQNKNISGLNNTVIKNSIQSQINLGIEDSKATIIENIPSQSYAGLGKNQQQQIPNKNIKNKATQISVILYPTELKQAFCTKVCWLKTAIVFFGSCGVFLLNGNYKTYVKNNINDDQFLTIIGVIGSIGNGCTRFFWNLLFQHTGYRFVMTLNLLIQIIVYIALRFTVQTSGAYLFLIFLSNCCIGGLLVMAPTFLQIVFGERVGSNIYGFFWEVFGLANLVQYAYVSGLSSKITLNNVIYICLGMSFIALLLIILSNFETPWKNPQDQLGYCIKCRKKQEKQK